MIAMPYPIMEKINNHGNAKNKQIVPIPINMYPNMVTEIHYNIWQI